MPEPTVEIAVVPGGLTTPVPIIYKMFDYGTDYQSLSPEMGPIGSIMWFDWQRINPARGEYNWSANDVDCDGIKNGTDNCPQDNNPGQEDGDADGKGDMCDKCPSTPNPGDAKCPAQAVTIEQVRNDSVPPNFDLGDEVMFQGAVVIGVRKQVGSSNGFYLSDETQGPWHCIFVHTGGDVPTLSLGDRIDIQGEVGEYNGINQLTNGSTITSTTAGAPLPELVASARQTASCDSISGPSGMMRGV